jgi:catechol 2,3-dioxygenase-like lactoylglutathione lyase family enzyme
VDVSVRYIVDDVDAAIEFYRDRLGFDVDMHPVPGFARLSRDGLLLLLNAPGAGGAGAGRWRTPTRRVESLPAHGG